MYEVISNSLKELEQGKNIVLATVVNTKGSTPQKIGSKLLIRDDGSTVGTLDVSYTHLTLPTNREV